MTRDQKQRQESKQSIHILPDEITNLIAGGLAGMLAKTLVAPIDRVKILYQVTATPFYLRDVPSVISNIIQQEGFTALWRGNTATLIRVFPYAGIQFMVFHKIKAYFEANNNNNINNNNNNTNNDNNNGLENSTHRNTTKNNYLKHKNLHLTPIQSLLAGSTAGAVSVLFTYPLDLTRAQLAVLKKKTSILSSSSSRKSLGFANVLFSNYTKGGIPGLFRGISPTLLGILPYAGIAFSINEQAKKQLFHITQREPTTMEKIPCGALSGLVAQSITYPLEVIRRRMQTIGIVPTSGTDAAVDVLTTTNSTTSPAANINNNNNNNNTSTNNTTTLNNNTKTHQLETKPPSMTLTIRKVLQEQGIRGLFKGLSMNWLKGPVTFAISFTTFDFIQELILDLTTTNTTTSATTTPIPSTTVTK